MAVRIPISRGLFALVDDQDAPLVLAFKWTAKPRDGSDPNRFYAYRTAVIDGVKRSIYLHRFLTKTPDNLTVDHVNGDGLDNRRVNLRVCTRSQNNTNRKYANVTGFRGVQLAVRSTSKYRVVIETGSGIFRVTGFASAETAARAYDALAHEFQGEFAVLNFPSKRVA